MTIVRYRPWSEANSLNHQLNRMFEEIFTPAGLTETGNYSKPPAAELTETEDTVILKLELPGIDAAELNIEATAKSISVSGERKSEVSSENEGKTTSEFRYGSFQRVITLPVKVQNTQVRAEYTNGILHLILPKAVEEMNRVVKVNLNQNNA